MATAIATARRAEPETLADVLHRLGDVPVNRIPMRPYPGAATVQDVVNALEANNKRIYELVDGILVEKDMGLKESFVALHVGYKINVYLDKHDLGFVTGADGAMEIMPELVRIPDVSFISWDDVEGDEVPDEPVPNLVPRLAVEVISEGNTPGEMTRKLRDYFEAGVELVWLLYPKTQTAEVYVSPTEKRVVAKNQALDGGDVLPGFKLSLKEVFQRKAKRRRGA
jgi:Uma2 family endonuclease